MASEFDGLVSEIDGFDSESIELQCIETARAFGVFFDLLFNGRAILLDQFRSRFP
jgi:hypothetical protein